ncbi:CoA pyrophosphatase [Pseudoroseomonas cervicalis]|uniref:NUDIX hydrolase n=1 Tax=Teichococcus cervicalis TaxID=204525 RepID=UPI0027802A1C|nr:CoA pyrophosphatase [Pseudoroseomonas cervicalis]MDQ1080585.1 8-oxo-dGTP pyrophosphatase MutT (NUDIX family) [Pseudoroseomonas cervicalis]
MSGAASRPAGAGFALDPEELTRRLSDPARLRWLAERVASEDRALGEQPLDSAAGPATLGKPSAVLVPVVLGPRPSLLLTLRAAKLSSHAGQVSFPGGRIEPGENPEQAALREAAEEIGLDPRLPRLLGRLPGHVTGTGYHVTPVLALLEPPLNILPSPDEVEQAFEYDLAALLDPALPERRTAIWKGERRSFYVWPHATHYVWGATAAIMRNLALLLRHPDAA